MGRIICGLQQIGIGVENLRVAWEWYNNFFGMDLKIFEDEAEAPLMTDYTGERIQKRKAVMAMSLEGGGGFEIWQFSSRVPSSPEKPVKLGDYGIIACKIKSKDIQGSFDYMQANNVNIISSISTAPNGVKHFFLKDPFENVFQVVEGDDWFKSTGHPSKCGGAIGAIIGVSDIEKSLKYYQQILDHDHIDYDLTGNFDEFQTLPNGKSEFRRVLLKPSTKRSGPFSPLYGNSAIELIEIQDQKESNRIFENRYWGDLGFIHICFDVQRMDALKKYCSELNAAFKVDSANSFDMGDASGRFAYIEDNNGTLIELVETHKVPIMKSFGWYLNLKNNKPGENLPRWIIGLLRLSRKKV